MKTDRELLKLAAKAIADHAINCGPSGCYRTIGRNEDMGCDVMAVWNPLANYGDALQLAASLNIHIEWSRLAKDPRPTQVQASPWGLGHLADVQLFVNETEKISALCRAIVNVSAAIAEATHGPTK